MRAGEERLLAIAQRIEEMEKVGPLGFGDVELGAEVEKGDGAHPGTRWDQHATRSWRTTHDCTRFWRYSWIQCHRESRYRATASEFS